MTNGASTTLVSLAKPTPQEDSSTAILDSVDQLPSLIFTTSSPAPFSSQLDRHLYQINVKFRFQIHLGISLNFEEEKLK